VSDNIELTADEARRRFDAGEVQIVDVREPYEWDAGRIAGAKHIELERLAGRADELPKDKPVIFQCRVGRRSALATDAFRAVGFDAYNMRGGIEAWANDGLPLEPEGGTVADH
jgi:hydroxyacylglutathione hydrolase/adenylyltransferase/sulfurtransferase